MVIKNSIDANDTSYAVGGIIAKPKRIASVVYRFNPTFAIIIDLNGFIIF